MNILLTLRLPIQEHDVSHLPTSSFITLNKILSLPPMFNHTVLVFNVLK